MPTDDAPRVIDIARLTEGVRTEWRNFEIARVNDHAIRCSVLDRDFHWHRHDDTDEAFLVIEGRLAIDLEGSTLRLGPGQMATLPAGTRHRTRAEGRVVNLTFERRGTDPRGDDPGEGA